jgi:hypothetical protein
MRWAAELFYKSRPGIGGLRKCADRCRREEIGSRHLGLAPAVPQAVVPKMCPERGARLHRRGVLQPVRNVGFPVAGLCPAGPPPAHR